jgi:hypothetical protein
LGETLSGQAAALLYAQSGPDRRRFSLCRQVVQMQAAFFVAVLR